MPYVPGFEYDIYISYAPDDIQWARRFFNDLHLALRMLAHREVRIFFDERDIVSGDVYGEQAREAVNRSAIFIPLLSSAYVRGNWTLKELSWVYETGRTRQIVPIELSPLEYGALPILDRVQPMRFWVDTKESTPHRLTAESDLREYSKRVDALARRLASVLEPAHRQFPTSPSVESSAFRRTIHVGSIQSSSVV